MADVRDKDINPLEYQLLKIMKESDVPLGAGGLETALNNSGAAISEATVGRLLRTLRQKEFLKKDGFKGHLITDKGMRHLADLEKARQFGNNLNQLLQSGPMHGHSVTDILVARRALEREAAFQAAVNSTPDDIVLLETIIRTQYDSMGKNENYSDPSIAFHRKIVEMAHSPILKNLYELLGLSVQWQDFFIGTFKMYNQPLNVSHEKILDAIKEHDAQKAARLMWLHLTDVMNNAKKLCLDTNS